MTHNLNSNRGSFVSSNIPFSQNYKKENTVKFISKNNNKPLFKTNVGREFGKDLTNIPFTKKNSNNKFQNEKRKASDTSRMLSKDNSIYHLRPRNSRKLKSTNNSFIHDKNNENVNMSNVQTDKMEIDVMNTRSQRNSNIQEKIIEERLSHPNPQVVDEYINEINDYLKLIENQAVPNCKFMKNQFDINEKMRAILIDWLVDVHLKFKLVPETLYVTVQLIDRYLEKVQVNRNKLQLVGVSALFIGCKYEEIYPPELKDFVYITDKAYSKNEILSMENHILKTLNFSITFPSPFRFLEIFFNFNRIKTDETIFHYARYLLELFLIDTRLNNYSPSLVAAACFYLAIKIKKYTFKEVDICDCSKYPEDQIKECARDICVVLESSEGKNSLQAVRNKFSSHKFKEVAKS